MKVLIVITSHDQLGDTGRKTGFWLEEFAAPYFVVGFAKGRATANRSKERFARKSDSGNGAVQQGRESTERVSQTVRLAGVKSEDYDTVFYPGGHGPMWDLAEDPVSIACSRLSTIQASRLLWCAMRPGCFAMLRTRAFRL